MRWLIKYFREAYEEIRKVSWPSMQTTRSHTILVIALSLILGVYFTALDYVLNLGLQKLL